MIRYALRRLAALPVYLVLVTIAVFLMVHALPGDPVQVMLGVQSGEIDAERVAAVRAEMGLDRPLPLQYARYMLGLLHGDMGVSIRTGRTVQDIVTSQWPFTFQLALASLALSVGLGIPGGILAALGRDSSLGTIVSILTMLGMSVPSFWLGIVLLMVFSYSLGWVPVLAANNLVGLVLPAAALSMNAGAAIARMTRSGLVDALGNDYIRVARAKGLSAMRIYSKHALKNALIPVVTLIAFYGGYLITGALIVEIVFGRPGLGRTLVSAILERDLPIAQGIILLAAAIVLILNVMADVLYSVIDPRLRS